MLPAAESNQSNNNNNNKANGVPTEVVIEHDNDDKPTTKTRSGKQQKSNNKSDYKRPKPRVFGNMRPPTRKRKTTATTVVDDDSDVISLDDLRCCVCWKGDATDENDVCHVRWRRLFSGSSRALPVATLDPRRRRSKKRIGFVSSVPLPSSYWRQSSPSTYGWTNGMWMIKIRFVRGSMPKDVFPEVEQKYFMAMQWKEASFGNLSRTCPSCCRLKRDGTWR